MAGIFISYRRSDSAGFAGRLYNDLLEHFGSGYIFRDIATLIPGEPFPKAIERALSTCHVLIVVIGQQWLTEAAELIEELLLQGLKLLRFNRSAVVVVQGNEEIIFFHQSRLPPGVERWTHGSIR